MKRGYAILMDSILALISVIIIFITLSGTTFMKDESSSMTFQKLHYISEDAMDSLNKKGVLDQVGEYWAAADGNTSSENWANASATASDYLEVLIPPNVGYMFTAEGDVIANNSRGRDINMALSKTHALRLLVGYGRGLPTRGNVARVFLSNIKEKQTSAYSYFGGYVGQGNITIYVRDIPADATIQQACLELNAGDDFTLYVNDAPAGTFTRSGGNMSASVECESCVAYSAGCGYIPSPASYFTTGSNKVELRFTGSDINKEYVGGGFVRVAYNTSEMDTDEIAKTGYYWFPGIKGVLNVYDSFYVPGRLQSMSLYVHLKSNYSVFLNIGAIKVFNLSSGNSSEMRINMSNTDLQNLGLVYYPDMSRKTVPIRLGTENISYEVTVGNADIILATDLSGSMASGSKLSDAKAADREFVNSILNLTGQRIGLVSYGNALFENSTETTRRWKVCCNSSGTTCTSWNCTPYSPMVGFNDTSYIRPDRYEETNSNGYSDAKVDINITTNKTILNNTINSYSAAGGTCIACGIHAGVKELIQKGDSGKIWALVLMTDGQATMAPIDPGATDQYSLNSYMPQNYSFGSDYALTGFNAAVSAAREAYATYNIRVYAVGFGSGVKQDDLIAIAQAGNGSYYFASDRDQLIAAFMNISRQIETESLKSQTIYLSAPVGSFELYSDSNIMFDYLSDPEVGYGEISLKKQTERFNDIASCTGILRVPSSVVVSDVKITSFSGEHWTDYLRVRNSMNDREVYKLWQDYGGDYRLLGDPYIVNIPISYVTSGENTTLTIVTGDNETTRTGCSADDRAIYTARIQSLVGYGSVFPENEGCNWTIEFEDGSKFNAKIPSNYNGVYTCNYTSTSRSYNGRDAMADAVYRLMSHLDLDDNGKIDLSFDPGMINFEVGTAGGVKSLWGPAEFKLILWM